MEWVSKEASVIAESETAVAAGAKAADAAAGGKPASVMVTSPPVGGDSDAGLTGTLGTGGRAVDAAAVAADAGEGDLAGVAQTPEPPRAAPATAAKDKVADWAWAAEGTATELAAASSSYSWNSTPAAARI